MKTFRCLACTVLIVSCLLIGCSVEETSVEPGIALLPPSQQLPIREAWLETRHGMLLEMMRRHDVDMWIVVNEEFHDDPATEWIAPPLAYVGNRDYFVFVDTGEHGLRRVAITSFAAENLKRFFESPDEPRPAKEVLPELVTAHDPQTIAVSMGGRRGVTRSLTLSTHKLLQEILGPEMSSRLTSAAPLLEEYMNTRIPAELEHYRLAVRLTENLSQRAFSNEVVVPGTTTVGEIRSWLLDQYWKHGVDPWFDPDIRVQRRAGEPETSRGFLAVARDNTVIERGDLLHMDIGFNYMGLATDWQKMAYVLKEGERAVPAGLEAALAKATTVWELMRDNSRPGMAAGEVYEQTMAELEQLDIETQIYSHPLGPQGHGLGATIDFRSAKKDDAEQRSASPLIDGSYIAIEYNIADHIPEWDNKKVWIMQEDPAHLTTDGWQTFVPRQQSLWVIH